jgi:GTP-binding protein
VEFAGTVAEPDAPLPGDLPQIAFAGRSNVGKSSLINVVLGRTRKKIAHVSGRPGKTRHLNFFRVNDAFFLVDLPGFGYAKVPEHVRVGWRRLVEGYLGRKDGPVAVVHIVDARRKPTDYDLQMLEYLARLQLPALVVATKIDKLTRSRRARDLPELTRELGLEDEQVLAFSSKTGEGKDDLLAALGHLLEKETIR